MASKLSTCQISDASPTGLPGAQVIFVIGKFPLPPTRDAMQSDPMGSSFVGGPGVGKSTQCSRLARDIDIVHFSVGDLLRIVPPSPLRDLIDSQMRSGGLVPNEIILPSLQNQIDAKMREGKRRFIVDGFPRNLDQAVMFEEEMVKRAPPPRTISRIQRFFHTDQKWCDSEKCKSIATLHFDCRPEIMTQRVAQRAESSGRIDDNPATLQLRQEGFSVANAPITTYYRSLGRLVEVSSTPESVSGLSFWDNILINEQINCNRPLDDIYEEFKTIVEVSQPIFSLNQPRSRSILSGKKERKTFKENTALF